MTSEEIFQIYFYSFPAYYQDQIILGKRPQIKIGYTSQKNVEKYIKASIKSTSHPEDFEIHAVRESKQKDHPFHNYLERNGIERCTGRKVGNEWFYIDVEKALVLFDRYEKELSGNMGNRESSLLIKNFTHCSFSYHGLDFDPPTRQLHSLELCSRYGIKKSQFNNRKNTLPGVKGVKYGRKKFFSIGEIREMDKVHAYVNMGYSLEDISESVREEIQGGNSNLPSSNVDPRVNGRLTSLENCLHTILEKLETMGTEMCHFPN